MERLEAQYNINNPDLLLNFLKQDNKLGIYTENKGKTWIINNKISWGISISSSLFFKPIHIIVKIDDSVEPHLLKVYTPVRIDLLFIYFICVAMFLVSTYFQIFKSEPIPFWINLILLPFIPFFFRFIINTQTNYLKNKFINVLINENYIK